MADLRRPVVFINPQRDGRQSIHWKLMIVFRNTVKTQFYLKIAYTSRRQYLHFNHEQFILLVSNH